MTVTLSFSRTTVRGASAAASAGDSHRDRVPPSGGCRRSSVASMRRARSFMISSPCESTRSALEAAPVVGRPRSSAVGRVDAALDVDRPTPRACRTALFIASWAMRSSSASTSGRSRVVLLVDGDRGSGRRRRH